jgi:probable RNA-binding protein EIF1AD
MQRFAAPTDVNRNRTIVAPDPLHEHPLILVCRSVLADTIRRFNRFIPLLRRAPNHCSSTSGPSSRYGQSLCSLLWAKASIPVYSDPLIVQAPSSFPRAGDLTDSQPNRRPSPTIHNRRSIKAPIEPTTPSIMAGLGRRTHYRKHLTDQVLFDLPVPNEETDQVGKIVATRGSNQFDVLLSDGTNSKVLAILPTKYRKLVWLKRNDFVIVESGLAEVEEAENQEAEAGGTVGQDVTVAPAATMDDATGGGIRYMIKHILYKDQIRNLIDKGLWPVKDPEFHTEQTSTLLPGSGDDNDDNDRGMSVPMAPSAAAADGIVYDANYNEEESEDDDDADLFVNTNRVAAIQLEDSSSSDEGDE